MGDWFKQLIFVSLLVSLIFLTGCKSGPRGAYDTCSSDTMCFSQKCVNGYCAPSSVGESCAINQDCSSQLCKNNSCVSKAFYCGVFNLGSICLFIAVLMLIFLITDIFWNFHPLALINIPVEGKVFGIYIFVMIILFMLGFFLPACV